MEIVFLKKVYNKKIFIFLLFIQIIFFDKTYTKIRDPFSIIKITNQSYKLSSIIISNDEKIALFKLNEKNLTVRIGDIIDQRLKICDIGKNFVKLIHLEKNEVQIIKLKI